MNNENLSNSSSNGNFSDDTYIIEEKSIKKKSDRNFSDDAQVVEKISIKNDYLDENLNNSENFSVESNKPKYNLSNNENPDELYNDSINNSDLSSDEYTELGNSNNYLKREKWGTPTTLLLSGNIVVDSIGGYVEQDEFTSFIKKNIIFEKPEEETTTLE